MKILLLIILFPNLAYSKGFGVATLIRGKPIVQDQNGQRKVLVLGSKVFESDTVITNSTSLVRLAMMDTNVIDIYPNSKLLIKEYLYNPKENKKNVSLVVSEGKIKSTVRQKYDDKDNKYNVQTPVIVAGVRGTIFSTAHEKISNRSEIYTHEGHVVVAKLNDQQVSRELFSVHANQRLLIDNKTEKPAVQEIPRPDVEKSKKDDASLGFAKSERNRDKDGSDRSDGYKRKHGRGRDDEYADIRSRERNYQSYTTQTSSPSYSGGTSSGGSYTGGTSGSYTGGTSGSYTGGTSGSYTGGTSGSYTGDTSGSYTGDTSGSYDSDGGGCK